MLTIIEAAKLLPAQSVDRAIIEIYGASTAALSAVPFSSIEGNSYGYNIEEALPGVGFRGVNEGYSESTGVLNPQSETLKIAGGDLDVDKFILSTHGESVRSEHEAMKLKALSQRWAHAFIKGDSSVDQREFDGLQRRLQIGGPQVIDAGSANGGDPLLLSKLDEAIDAVDMPTHLIMNKTMRRRFSAAARANLIGDLVWTTDSLGRRIEMYNDLPIVTYNNSGDVYQTLSFDEPAPGDLAATTTSLYVASFGEGMLHGIQNGPMQVRDLGELEDKPAERTRVEWYTSIVLKHPRAAARLRGISNSPIAA